MTNNGWRKPTPGLVVAEKYAQAGEGLFIPKTQAIVALKKVAAAIGLKASDMMLLDTLAAITQPQDWEQGRRAIVWSSNAFLEEQTGFSLSALKRRIRRLCEAGVMSMKDSTNGKRWGRRDDDGYIIQAYGFDLTPLAARAEEFEALHAQLQEERQFCSSLRNKITISRRVIRAKIEKALENRLTGPWRDLQEEFSMMLESLPRSSTPSNKLLDIVDWFTALEQKVEQAFTAAFDWPQESDAQNPEMRSEAITDNSSFSEKMNPTEFNNEPHILTTNQPNLVISNSFENKDVEKSVPNDQATVELDNIEQVNLDINWNTHSQKRSSEIDIPMLMIACPQFADMARMLENGFIRNWNDLHRAAAQIRGIAGISEDAWNAANKVLGPARAAATIALIFDKHSSGEVKSAGGYLRAMVERAQAGELHLDRSFYGRLSEARAN